MGGTNGEQAAAAAKAKAAAAAKTKAATAPQKKAAASAQKPAVSAKKPTEATEFNTEALLQENADLKVSKLDDTPDWAMGHGEQPAGVKHMGGWTMKVFTHEQQNRLGVNKY